MEATLAEQWLIVHYHCLDCNERWTDEWSCACDDECPKCGVVYNAFAWHAADDTCKEC